MKQAFEFSVIWCVYLVLIFAIWTIAVAGSWKLLRRCLEYHGLWTAFYGWYWDTKVMPRVRELRAKESTHAE